ncbi:11362_t:CDS:2 [Cetraspora pellucida]|uniref:11362_t:CDS:1 n=1 Tax=Cetraspora pellucida TaxID=1433469 RepID=A0ACA9KCM5_9GLOM|nr:11362_t:CDS:2 [Cetraspora pellucida]
MCKLNVRFSNYCAKSNGLVFFGPIGIGKTAILAMLANELPITLGFWCDGEIRVEKYNAFARQVQEAEEFNQTLPDEIRYPRYEVSPRIDYTSQLINTKEIAQLFQESKKQALELEIKKIEQEIKQPLTSELKELVGSFIQARKEMIKNEGDEEAKKKALELEDQLLDEKGLFEENIEKIIDYCKRLNITEQLILFGQEENIGSQVIDLVLK